MLVTKNSQAQDVPGHRGAGVNAAIRFVNNKFAAREWKYLEEELEQEAMSSAGEADSDALFDLDLDSDADYTPLSPTSPESASHRASPRAFSRAVCVSFAAGPVKAAPPADLEGRVKQLVSGFIAKSAIAASLQQQQQQQQQQQPSPQQHWSLEQLAAHLRSAGLAAEVMSPPSPDQRSPLTTRSIRDPFLVVSADPASAAGVNNSTNDVVIVDFALHDHLSVAPITPAYRRSLALALPGGAAAPWVGTRARLVSLVKSLAPAVSLNFSSQGMEVPPWRRTPALLRRWECADEPAIATCTAAGTQQQRQQQQPAPAVVIPAATFAANSSTPCLVVSGFEVGSTAVGQEPWRDAEHGSFAALSFGAAWLQGAALERQRREQQQQPAEAPRPRSEDSDDSTADLVAGVSPVSVFLGDCGRNRRRDSAGGTFGSLVKAAV
ncbi:hypothetical protein HXX76_002823 [Chlamydomonas incerta]|uniref:Uncharacterized protein n=1 Tax=Chlamydomonas incerta TaxID=51695 RepID=A0A835TER6_CHLIN|nr:hypothetical protein HXX76_002823 [Chlamydomonas incerta]|eukprot:KAG2442741.1 hypothetical protein HXX76_002823 [Chlamydomonas incerta]